MPKDLFISYAHIDNQPFGDTKGWVDQLMENLRIRLSQVLGSEVAIWWDKRLQGDQYFLSEIGDRVSEARLLAPVVTPRYVRSEWCRGELKEFCQGARIDARIGNHSRIFKIVKTPVAEEQVPDELRPMLGYIFYDLDDKNRPREFRPELANKDQRYWDKLEDLAWDMRDAIEQLRAAPNESAPSALNEALPLERKVYLAETAPELSVERDRVKRELQQHNYYVLPDRALPLHPAEMEAAVGKYLDRSVLSIHMIGGRFEYAVETDEPNGVSQTGEPPSTVVQRQVELAGERANSGQGFSRVIWLPPGLDVKDPRQEQFIAGLQDGIGAGTELLQTSLEDLKRSVIEKLVAAKPIPMQMRSAAARAVYLMYDNRDAGDIQPIGDFLFEHGFEVIPPVFEGDSVELAQYHRESLLNCDAALLYYGSANQMWLRSKMWDLQKARGWGRPSPVPAAVYISGPPTAEKERFRTLEAQVIQNFSDFSPDKLQPFLHAVKGGNGGQRP